MTNPDFVVLPDPPSVANETAERFVRLASDAIADHGRFSVALSGGSTPKAVYPLLVAQPLVGRVDWSRVEFFWGDDRSVPPDDPESNFGVAYQMLVSRLPGVAPQSVHRMPADASDRDAAAQSYADEIVRVLAARAGEPPVFDLIWLGMGPDGHTASLFPGSAALDVTDRWVVANWAPALETWRMTFTFPVLNAARHVLFVATGADKADALAQIRTGSTDLPAGRVHAQDTTWLVDAAAAGETGGEQSPG
jgi:6-phosphogluconolactonase